MKALWLEQLEYHIPYGIDAIKGALNVRLPENERSTTQKQQVEEQLARLSPLLAPLSSAEYESSKKAADDTKTEYYKHLTAAGKRNARRRAEHAFKIDDEIETASVRTEFKDAIAKLVDATNPGGA